MDTDTIATARVYFTSPADLSEPPKITWSTCIITINPRYFIMIRLWSAKDWSEKNSPNIDLPNIKNMADMVKLIIRPICWQALP